MEYSNSEKVSVPRLVHTSSHSMVLKRLSLIVDASARSQILVIGAICFACPGMYNAITAMAGGIADAKVNNLANALL